MTQCYYLSVYSDLQRSTTPFFCSHPSAARLKPGKDYVLFPEMRCKNGICSNYSEVDNAA